MIKERLSTDLTGERHPRKCQACAPSLFDSPALHLVKWHECDDRDKKQRILVVLCSRHSRKLIQSHPRLYHEVAHNAPWPGGMEQCVSCRFRSELKCTNPEITPYVIPTPGVVRAHLKYGRRGSFVTMYPNPPGDCPGRSSDVAAVTTGEQTPKG